MLFSQLINEQLINKTSKHREKGYEVDKLVVQDGINFPTCLDKTYNPRNIPFNQPFSFFLYTTKADRSRIPERNLFFVNFRDDGKSTRLFPIHTKVFCIEEKKLYHKVFFFTKIFSSIYFSYLLSL